MVKIKKKKSESWQWPLTHIVTTPGDNSGDAEFQKDGVTVVHSNGKM
jgi:hypothetical protein